MRSISSNVVYSNTTQEDYFNPNSELLNNNGWDQGKVVKYFEKEMFKASSGCQGSIEQFDKDSFNICLGGACNNTTRKGLREFILWLIEMEKKH